MVWKIDLFFKLVEDSDDKDEEMESDEYELNI